MSIDHLIDTKLALMSFPLPLDTAVKRPRGGSTIADAEVALRSLESTTNELQDAMAAVNHARRVLHDLEDRPEAVDIVSQLRPLIERVVEVGSEAVGDWFQDKLVCFDIETQAAIPEHSSGKTIADLEVSVVCLKGVWVDAPEQNSEELTCWDESAYRGMPIEFAFVAFDVAKMITGFNVLRFDFPVLRKYYHGDNARYEAHLRKTVDMLTAVRAQAGRSFKLSQLIALNPGVPEKLGDGLGAVKLWTEGKYDALEEYCQRDVEAELALALIPSIVTSRVTNPIMVSARTTMIDEDEVASNSQNSDASTVYPEGDARGLVQNTPAWYEFRKGKIGASQAASFLRLSYHQTRDDAFERLLGQTDDETGSEHMRRGQQMEPVVAQLYSSKTGAHLSKTGSWVHSVYEWLFSSPDRLIDGGNALLEIKSVTKLAPRVPDHFLIQLQVQLATVPSAKHVVLVQYDGTTLLSHTVRRDKELTTFVIAKLRDVYASATRVFDGSVAAENVFADDVSAFTREDQVQLKQLMDDTHRIFVDGPTDNSLTYDPM